MARPWCGAESVRGHALCRLGPKLMSRRRPEKKGTKECGNMLGIVTNSKKEGARQEPERRKLEEGVVDLSGG